MATTFSRSLRSLNCDRTRPLMVGFIIGGTLLVAGFGWFTLAKVAVYKVSPQARLEVEAEVHPVAAAIRGQVTANRAIIGREVEAGEVLIEFDCVDQKLQLVEEQARVTALKHRIEALRNEIISEELAWPEQLKAADAAVEEARALQVQARATAQFAREDVARLKTLFADRIVSDVQVRQGETREKQTAAMADAATLEVARLEAEKKAREKTHRSRLAELQSDRVLLEGNLQVGLAAVRRCEHEISKRRIVAPVAGKLAEFDELQVGSFVEAGDKLGAIVPAGELKAVAYFPPLGALGRIREGQPARLRLDGFPWTQYGSLNALVTGVAREPRDGRIRVEFSVDPASAPAIPMQHGLPGTIEVRVERVSPATLVLRAAGKMLTRPVTPPEEVVEVVRR